MKRPVVHLKTEVDIDRALDWLYANGWSLYPGRDRSAARIYLISRLDDQGADLYPMQSKNLFEALVHPIGWQHSSLEPVNSLVHWRHHLARCRAPKS